MRLVTYPRLAISKMCPGIDIPRVGSCRRATKERRDGREKEASVNRYRFTHALHA